MIQRLFNEPETGKTVRELHILSASSCEEPFDDLEKVISAGKLPYIHSLGLYFSERWCDLYDDEEPWKPRPSFWENLRENCPRLRELIVRDPTLLYTSDDFGIFELQVRMYSLLLEIPC